jgi:hypothetical protein
MNYDKPYTGLHIWDEVDILWEAIEKAGGEVVDTTGGGDEAVMYVGGLDEYEVEQIVKTNFAGVDYSIFPEDGLIGIGLYV